MEEIKRLEEQLAYYKTRNEELNQKVEELTDFFENASLPLHWVDENGIIIWANQAELDALGYSREEYIGYSISSFHVDEEVIGDILTRLTNNETLIDYSARLKCKDGSIKYVLINSNVLRKDGKFVHTRCFTRDVTEKFLEEKRKNDFVAIVSHELKTPLTTVSSYVQMLLRNSHKSEDFNLQALTRIDVQVKKMSSMIHNFLDLARMEDGNIKLNTTAFRLMPLIEEIAGDARILDDRHQIVSQGCEDIIVIADREKIGQVLMNLVSNAIKYSPVETTITIGCRTRSGKVNIYVSDEGVGISQADQKRLFERFYRVTSEKTNDVAGFGIGLYLVSEIVNRHNSQIEVESEENKGSTFHFDLEQQL